MQGGNFQNSKQDGMTMFITVAEAMEQFEQIEVVNGLSASLYGPANPSGMFNFVTKRPTDYDLREVTASYVSDSVGTVKADLGGRIDPGGIVSYRVNALYGSGEGYVDMSHQRRVLGDIGIDVRPWEHGVLELNYSNYTLNDVGYPGWFTYNETIHLPPTPDPSRVGFGQPYAGTELRTQTSSARIKQDFGSDWHLVAGILNQDATRNINTAINNLTSNSGNYTTSFASGFAPRFVITSDTAYLNGTFDTLGIGHDFTFGTAGYRSSSYSVITPATAASLKLGTANVYDPVIFAEPAAGPPNVFLNYDSSDVYQQGFNINDLLKFTDQWSARFGASQDWFHTNNFNNKSVRTTQYVDHGVSPTGSIIFKPATNMTTYFTYASALQAGDLAPGTAKNSGEGLAPYRSKEYELGYKASLSGIDLTAALFRIERPFANLDPVSNIFGISGQQVNRGLELSAIGEVIDGLTLYGGVQLLNARLEHTPLATTNDKIYVGAPKVKGNMLFEYKIPGLAGLVATLDYQFSGTRAANDTNSYFAPGYNLFDLGARYTSNIWSKPVTWRLSVDNVTDRHYWSTIAPSNLTGANTGNLLAHFGSPRMLLASVSVNL
jgi:iron complex outermembrane receptor protein